MVSIRTAVLEGFSSIHNFSNFPLRSHPFECDGKRPLCGCDLCTDAVYNADSGGFTCGDRIEFLQTTGFSEDAACEEIATQFTACSSCHPACTITAPTSQAPFATNSPTRSVSVTPTPEADTGPRFCECFSCTPLIWESLAGQFSCGARIEFLQTVAGGTLSLEESCRQVGLEFPDSCGPCNPDICDAPTLSPSLTLPTIEPSRSPIMPPTEADETIASISVVPTFGPAVAEYCGCFDCTAIVWDTLVRGVSCGTRIEFFQMDASSNLSLEESCRRVALDLPDNCGPCNPDTCDSANRSRSVNSSPSQTMNPLPTPTFYPVTAFDPTSTLFPTRKPASAPDEG